MTAEDWTGERLRVSVQVYPDGIRHIRADKRVNEWKTPGKKTIVRCAVNQRQVVIALTGGELVYFEMDPVSVCVQASSAVSRRACGWPVWGHGPCLAVFSPAS